MNRQSKRRDAGHRLDRAHSPSLRNWRDTPVALADRMAQDATLPMGWGRLIFGHTFSSSRKLAGALLEEKSGERDIAFYLRDPHVVLSISPQELFLDPSHTYRLWSHAYQGVDPHQSGFIVRRVRNRKDADEINRIYASRGMVTCDPEFMLDKRASKLRTYFIAETRVEQQIVGTVTGVDHVECFSDPENGASLWCLAVDSQCQVPRVGQQLVRHLVEHLFTRGRAYVDLSVMHDNREAIQLYEKLGFQRVPVFCVKRKNPINRTLFLPAQSTEALNPYAQIITEEAQQRGIRVEIIDAEGGFFRLQLGGRTILCRESLTELTTATAMSMCDDKRVTLRVLRKAGIRVPEQRPAREASENERFLDEHGKVVVKPARGEQGAGVGVGIDDPVQLAKAIEHAKQVCEDVLLEAFVPGDDLRIIVINHKVVAAAVRKPPCIRGTGEHTIRQLLEKYNRRRASATGGESSVPFDNETERCITQAGYDWDAVLPTNEMLVVRKAANLHTGGTIHDVTDRLHPALIEASTRATRALDIPVTGLDLLVPDVSGEDYVMIEANERPGLANHEPQPTARRFIDFLFPETVSAEVPG